jgi:cytochrome P450
MKPADSSLAIREADLESDPYPIYRRLQEEAPVCWVPSVNLWLVTRWADVEYVCKHPETFAAEIPDSALTRTIGPNMLHSDGACHRRLRAIVEPAFRARAIGHYPHGIIAATARELAGAIAGRGRADLIKEFAQPLSLRVLKQVLGIEVSDETLSRWSDGLATGAANFSGDPERQAYADRVIAEIDLYLENSLEHPEAVPKDTALRALLFPEAGARPTREEIRATVKLLVIGGLKTTGDLIGVALFALLGHPDQLREVVEDLTRVDGAVEEAIRWLSPVGTATRRAVRACELCGTELPEGAVIGAVLAAANRDPRVFPKPECFDIHRPPGNHLAFATGPHACVGALLGRYQGRVGLRVLFETIKTLRLDPERPVEVRGWEFRAPTGLRVEF